MAKNDNTSICAALTYLVIGLLWFFLDPKMRKNALVKHHAQQGLVVVVWFVLVSVASIIPVLGWLVYAGGVIIGIVWIVIGAVGALSGKKTELFWIGDLAKNLKF